MIKGFHKITSIPLVHTDDVQGYQCIYDNKTRWFSYKVLSLHRENHSNLRLGCLINSLDFMHPGNLCIDLLLPNVN